MPGCGDSGANRMSKDAAGPRGHDQSHGGFWKHVLGSVGVVYGDIGTSPLYAMREAMTAAGRDGLSPAEVIGIVSLLLWTLIIIVTVKYVVLILRADNDGEGGTLSLVALAQRATGRRSAFLFVLGVAGTALFYGDAIITPAISVLSAVEGLTLVTPSFAPFVELTAVAILVVLFAIQSRGTAQVATFFGPITLLWFLTIGGLGLYHAGDKPQILAALNPLQAVGFLIDHGLGSLAVMGSVFLAVTGAEALYADMGHFGRGPIRMAWSAVVLPALALNYIGQGSLVLANPAAAHNSFFLLAPDWGLLPLVLLASPPAPLSTLRVPPAYMLVLGPFAARFGEPGTSSGPSAVGSESSWIWSRDRVNSGSPDTLEFLPVYTNDVGCEPPPVTVTFASVRLPHDTYMCVSSCAK